MKIFMKTTIALALASGIGAAQACSTAQWGTVTGAKAVSVKTGDADFIAGSSRYEGVCALEVTQGQLVSQTITGSGDTYFRFYVFAKTAQSGGDAQIFLAENGGSEAASLTLGNNTLNLVSGGSTVGSTALNAGEWSIVQLRINGTSASVWVNDLTATKITGTVTGGNVDKITLGGSTTQSDEIYFDSFVASNGQAIGNDGVAVTKLLAGDSNGDSVVNSNDSDSLLQHALDPTAASKIPSGTPDCNRDGMVNSNDSDCALMISLDPALTPTY